MSKRSLAGLERERERDRQPHRRNRPPRNWTRPCRCGLVFTSADVRTFCCASCPAKIGYGPHLPALVDHPTLSEVRRCRKCRSVLKWGSSTDGLCSAACRSRLTSTPISFGNCVYCGDLYCKRASRDFGYCSKPCARKAYKQRYRARRRSATVGGERFTLRQVAERDGWKCHICGKAVPDRPYAARKSDATIDHLVPVAAGGKHILSNVALAHNCCNYERRDGGTVQLRLVG